MVYIMFVGHALKMTYFVHPYDLLDESSPGKRRELTVPTVLQHKLGCSCSVGIETSTPHKLQGIPLLGCFKSQDGKKYVYCFSLNFLYT